jgi:hypothetical protein
VFVSDPSAEAERVAQQLRGAGYLVVDVPLSMLAARVAVQTPSAIIVDADASGVAEALLTARASASLPLPVLFLGHSAPEAARELDPVTSELSRGFFARPVDAVAIVERVQALAGTPESGSRAAEEGEVKAGAATSEGEPPTGPRSGSPPPTTTQAMTATEAWALEPPSSVGNATAAVPLSVRAPSSSPLRESPISARSGRPAISIRTQLSQELEALLAEAEDRLGTQLGNEVAPPSPEEEIEAVLPEALLAELDEPLDDDEDDALPEPPRTRAAMESERPASPGPSVAETNTGRALTPPPETRLHGGPHVGVTGLYTGLQGVPAADREPGSLGVAPTVAAPPMPISSAHSSPPPPPPPEGRFAPPPEPPQPQESHGDGPVLLGATDAPRLLAAAISGRKSGCFTVESDGALRRIVLRDGDIVTAASSLEEETLLAFLAGRGDVRRDQVKELYGKVPPFGRHAGAALVGHGLLRQDQLWPILRAHAEWIVARMVLAARGTARFELEAPGRLKQEPSVFGGSSGAEVLVEVARRVIAPEEALQRLGGPSAIVADGPGALLSECALEAHERTVVEQARGMTLEVLHAATTGGDMASVLYALALLSVISVALPAPLEFMGRAVAESSPSAATAGGVDALDITAVRERVRARYDLVSEADYFTLLGIPREATGYEVRRAYRDLRKSFEPTTILTPDLADLEAEVRTIVMVLDEAYEILRDGARRERYRRALGG